MLLWIVRISSIFILGDMLSVLNSFEGNFSLDWTCLGIIALIACPISAIIYTLQSRNCKDRKRGWANMLLWIVRISSIFTLGVLLLEDFIHSDRFVFIAYFACPISAIIYTLQSREQPKEDGIIKQYYERKKLENEVKALKAKQEIDELRNREA